MSVKLRKKQNKDGTVSLYLDVYRNGERKYEFLNLLKLSKAANPIDRQANKENLDLAKKIAIKRAQELSANDYSMVSEAGKNTIVTTWMQAYIDNYKKKDKRNMQGVLNRFINFLVEDKKQGLLFGRLNELIISDFQDYLRQHSKGEGASSYFSRFKKMIKQAYRQKLITANPALEVRTIKGNAKKKETLTMEEIQLLANTPTESKEVRRAALLSLVTGLRWADISTLKWGNINVKEKQLSLPQSKTGRHVFININETAVKLLGKPATAKALIFVLPTANGANKTLKAWVKRAGITKKITWHNLRHSFGTNLVFNGANLSTASSLLGHSSYRHTQRYVTAANELKERATDTLNIDV